MFFRRKHAFIRPSPFFLKAAIYTFAIAAIGFGLGHYLALPLLIEWVHWGLMSLLFVAGALSLVDLISVNAQAKVECERIVAGSVSVSRWFDVQVRVHHHFTRPKIIWLFDDIDARVDYQHLPLAVTLFPNRFSQATFRLRAKERGVLDLAAFSVRTPSPLNFWQREYKCPVQSSIKVYPDFSAMTAYSILATDNHFSQLGIKRRPRRGEGLEFNQLRDYRIGDSLRQIDWNATSRRNKLISREYQDERDQQIVFLVDSGRRMRAKDDELNHFDHALHATLMVSYIALRQGDSVGVLSFGGDSRWLAPQKGPANMKVILNGLFDLHTSNNAPDYVSAAESLIQLQPKRSLVIFVTNTRDEDVDEVVMAVELLRKKHLVLVANIRELIVERMLELPIDSIKHALSYAAANHYLNSRREAQRKTLAKGVFSIDCLAKELPARVTNSYLEIKRAGVL